MSDTNIEPDVEGVDDDDAPLPAPEETTSDEDVPDKTQSDEDLPEPDHPKEEASSSSEESSSDGGQDLVDSVVVESAKWAAPVELQAMEAAFQDTAEQEAIYALDYVNGLKPLMRFGSLFFRFPFGVRRKKTAEGYIYEFYWKHLGGLIFKITGCVIFGLSVLTTINMGSFFLNFPRNSGGGLTSEGNWTGRAEEVYQFYRNSAGIVIWFAMLLHLNVANYRVIVNQKFIATYLGYSASALKMMKLHSAEELGQFTHNILIVLIFCTIAITTWGVMRLTPVSSGLVAFLSHLTVRFMTPIIYTFPAVFDIFKWTMSGMFSYCMIGAKIFPILYILQCEVIKRSLELWNQRLDIVLNREDSFLVHGNRLGKRTGFRVLFEDHTILLDLINGADTAFSEIIDSYFFSQVVSICFEWYFFWRSFGGGPEFQGIRVFDSGFIFIYTLQSCVILFLALFTSAAVSERSYDGLEAVRRQGVFGRKSPEELYFLMSLYMSFQGHFETATSGAGYFAFNSDFIATVAGTLMSYFIILIQFSHPIGMPNSDILHVLVANERTLIREVEETRAIIPGVETGV